ncbi:hypothetical protein A5636_05585 [Mycobacterium asiaticum]|uniref:Lipoprotein LppJ n=1 Tax=Mycobacterium asiaticum TaxID=1790 RepID=A0A1A3N071_MYCAS|nr:hypothetical protein A5636_05585 [Mycobacterium asiaticum]
MAGALAISLTFGGIFVSVDRLHSTPADALSRPDTATDEQSQAQALGAAQRLVSVARLHPTTAGYLLMSCAGRDDPPYQGAIHLTFALPAGTSAHTYLPAVVDTLVSDGWTEGSPPGGHAFGSTLSKHAVTAIVYRHDTNPAMGVLRIYGECRNMNDHRNDTTGWVDVTGQVGSAP